MTAPLLLGIIMVGPAVVLFVLALLRRGSGAELLDWDPTDRIAARAAADAEDVERALAQHNARRADAGLPPEDEAEFARRVAREGKPRKD
jgi:hypothetical protein